MVDAVRNPSLLKVEFHRIKGCSSAAQFGTHIKENMDPCTTKCKLTALPGGLENLGLIWEVVQKNDHCSGPVAGTRFWTKARWAQSNTTDWRSGKSSPSTSEKNPDMNSVGWPFFASSVCQLSADFGDDSYSRGLVVALATSVFVLLKLKL